MSVLASTWAWQQQITPNLKLVLVALADHAHDDGAGAYPSIELLAVKTGYSERQVKRNLKDLVEAGVIRIAKAASRHRPTEYALMMTEAFVVVRGDKMTPLLEGQDVHPGVTSGTEIVSQMSPEPSVEPSREPSTTPPSADAEAGEARTFGPHQPHPGTEQACCLVAAWYDGSRDREGETGEKPFPTVAKRMRGQATNMAKDLKTPEDWTRAIAAAYSAGCQGLWDLAQGVPVQRRSQFTNRVDEEKAIYGPGHQRVLDRLAARDARILAEREAQGS